MGLVFHFARRRRLPRIYRRTRFFGLSHYRVANFGVPLGLVFFFVLARIFTEKFIGQTTPVIIADVLGAISVIDGDTVRSAGYTYRLVGFDTPEKGTLAHCQRERALAKSATRRLDQLLASGQVELKRVACSCRSGTEDTRACNYGRRCAVLKVGGRDVGPILIGEGLAYPYFCSDTHCPRRRSWCG
jgi:endonuclease YncB( thermonuclease family)